MSVLASDPEMKIAKLYLSTCWACCVTAHETASVCPTLTPVGGGGILVVVVVAVVCSEVFVRN